MGPDVEQTHGALAEVAARILIVDDEPPCCSRARVIEQMGHRDPRGQRRGARAIAALESETFRSGGHESAHAANQDGSRCVRARGEHTCDTPPRSCSPPALPC